MMDACGGQGLEIFLGSANPVEDLEGQDGEPVQGVGWYEGHVDEGGYSQYRRRLPDGPRHCQYDTREYSREGGGQHDLLCYFPLRRAQGVGALPVALGARTL